MLGALPVFGQSLWQPTLGVQFVSIGETQQVVSVSEGPIGTALSLDPGFGARLTLPLRGRWSLAANGDFIRADGAWLQEFTFGPRFRVANGRRWAVFASAGPGLLHGGLCDCAFINGGVPSASDFVVDLGGGFEARLARRWVWQAAVDDLVIHNPGGNFHSNNLQLSTGIAFRF
ncbi:MAG: hypothetical protein ACRD13_11625 [Terriglobales bacterium]